MVGPHDLTTMHSMEIDRNGLEVPSREECLRLLAGATLGRLAIHSGALPTIVPVNFALTPEGVVIRTSPGSKLDAAITNSVVAFEVDDYNSIYHSGWSVVVIGVAREITDTKELDAVRRLQLPHWAPGPADHFVCISTELVSGRLLRNPRHSPLHHRAAARAGVNGGVSA